MVACDRRGIASIGPRRRAPVGPPIAPIARRFRIDACGDEAPQSEAEAEHEADLLQAKLNPSVKTAEYVKLFINLQAGLKDRQNPDVVRNGKSRLSGFQPSGVLFGCSHYPHLVTELLITACPHSTDAG